MAERCAFETSKMNFLVVDDSHSMRRIIMRTLKDMQCGSITEADCGRAAWDVLNVKKIDFIICDWNMPGMKGIDLLREVRSDDRYKHIPFLMVSAESKPENIMEAIHLGVSNYLTKPFKSDILRKKIEVIIKARRDFCMGESCQGDAAKG